MSKAWEHDKDRFRQVAYEVTTQLLEMGEIHEDDCRDVETKIFDSTIKAFEERRAFTEVDLGNLIFSIEISPNDPKRFFHGTDN